MTDRDDVPLAFVDTETDGIHPGRRAWEVAIIRRDPGGAQRSWSVFVDIDLSTSDPFGLRVGRFYERHPLGRYIADRSTGGRMDVPDERGPVHAAVVDGFDSTASISTTEAAGHIAQLTHGAHLVGAVPNFDAEVFDRLLRDHGLAPAWHHHLIDVEALAVGWLSAKGDPLARPPWRSDELSRACGVEPATEQDRHTALGDADWAMRLYDAIVRYGAGPAS